MNKGGVLVDNNEDSEQAICGMLIELPLNRNLSQKLFAQLKTVLDK